MKGKTVWIVVVVVVLFALVGVAYLAGHRPAESAAALPQSEPKADVVKIGALLALTGSGANYGKSLQQGIEMAKDEVNASGGVGGKKLEVIYEDSQGDAKTGVNAFNKLVDFNKVPLVLGSISSVILAVAPVADQRQVVLVNSSAISPKIPERAENFLFSIMVSGAQEAKFMAQEYVRVHANEPIAVLFSNNSSGMDTKDTFVADLKAAGGVVAIEEGYELNATDFRTPLAKIKESGAHYAYLVAFSSREFARVLIQAKEMELAIKWFSYSGFETKETLELAGNAAEGVMYSYPDYSAQKAMMDIFQQKYAARYSAWPDIYTVTSYDGVKMLAQVIAKNGTSAIQIRDGLRVAGSFTGVFGVLRFAEKQYVTKPLLWKTVNKGHYEVEGTSLTQGR